jgi:multimeric flavodoxin WrbA
LNHKKPFVKQTQEQILSKNVLVLKSSPRINGNSNMLADRLEVGAKEAGANVESVMLHNLNIQPCDACDVCQETGVCVLKDDMQQIYSLIEEADAIVIAGPIYWFTISAQAKLCIDRWYALSPYKENFSGKQAGIILTYGDDDLHSSGGINAIHTFESMFAYLGVEIKGIVHGSAYDVGEIQKLPDLFEHAYQLGQNLAA